MGLFNSKKKKSAAKYEGLSESKKIRYIIRYSKQNRVIDFRAVGLLYNFKNICLFLRQSGIVYSNGDGRTSDTDLFRRWEFLNLYFKDMKSRGYPDFELDLVQVDYLLESIPAFQCSFLGTDFHVRSESRVYVFDFINHILNVNKSAVHQLLLTALKNNQNYHLHLLKYTNFRFDPSILRKLLTKSPFTESERLYLADFWEELSFSLKIGPNTKKQLTKILLDPRSSDDLDALRQTRISQLETQVELLTSQLAALRGESRTSISSLSFFGDITSPSETSKYEDINPSSDGNCKK